MAKNKTVHTCYGCPAYYTDKEDWVRYPRKHCGQDHFKCPYYWGEGEPLVLNGGKKQAWQSLLETYKP